MDGTAGPARGRLSEAEAIDLLVANAGRAGIFLDFDGVLAPIQLDPETVRPTPGVVEALSAVAGRVRRTAIVSARPVSFLRRRLGPVRGVVLYGHYGLQVMSADGTERTEPEALPWIPVLAEVAERARAELPSDVLVEQRPLSVTLHYRAAPDRRATVLSWAEEQAARRGVSLQHGRMVIEVRPPVRRDKGGVVDQETGDLRTAWYVGDDLSDLRAFEALARREAEADGFVGVRVAVANAETGGALAEAADFVIASTAEVPAFLDRLARCLERGSPAAGLA